MGDRTLVLSDGDVGGLLAALAASDRDGASVCLWTPESDEMGRFRSRAAAGVAELIGAEVLQPDALPGVGLSAMLMAAGTLAAGAGCGRVIWPVHAGDGDDILEVASANVDRAVLVSRLLALEGVKVEIECPYADLVPRQLADLVLDMDLPIWTCWWFDPGALPPALRAQAVEERERWTGLLQAAGWRGPLPTAHMA